MLEMTASTTYTEQVDFTSEPILVTVFSPFEVLSQFFCGVEEAIELMRYFDSEQAIELLTLLLTATVNHKEYGKPYLQPVYFEDSDEIAFVNVVFENCDWEEWKELEQEFNAHQSITKGMVAVTCIRGLVE
ncbi:MAG: hypothetical protein ACYCSA_09280 [Thermoplasmataceae archaeon]